MQTPFADVRTLPIVMAMVGFTIAGCSSDDKPDTAEQPPSAASAQAQVDFGDATDQETKELEIEYTPVEEEWDLDGQPVTVGGLVYTPASQWEDHGVQGERAAYYTYGPLQNESHPAILSIKFVKAADQTKYRDFFSLWVSRMQYDDGRDPESAAARHDREADGMTIHVQSMYGGYNPPTDERVEGEHLPRYNYRLLGVVVEAPEGLVVFELSGPDYTARVMIEAFMNGIYRLKKA